MPALDFVKEPTETYREAVQRVAKRQGLAQEVLEMYDYYINRGDEESKAAWCALYDWDCLDIVEDSEDIH